MAKQPRKISSSNEGDSRLAFTFCIETEYSRCISALQRTSLLSLLPKSKSLGVIGFDGKEYPAPTQEQVSRLFIFNKALVDRKSAQGFAHLELAPIAMSVPLLINLMASSICAHAANGTLFQTLHSLSSPSVPIRVNNDKHVWIWETLRQALDTDQLVYFPKEYSNNHGGQIKSEIIHDGCICAIPGWSVGLVEDLPMMPYQDQGLTFGGRRQLETGSSPREYIEQLKTEAYRGETGKTLEDFITEFITRLDTTDEVSNDVDDNNAMWCLGQYMKVSYADLVPTGRWIRKVGRARLDLHRTGNKRCTQSWGATTTVRLLRP